MNALIIYYSLSGNTEWAVKQLEELIPAKSFRLQPDKEPKKTGFSRYLTGGSSALRGESVELAAIPEDLDSYDTVILAGPIWAGTFPPAIFSFLQRCPLKNKRVALVATSMSGYIDHLTNKKMAPYMKDCESAGVLSLVSPLKKQEEARRKIEAFCEKLNA